LLVALYVIKIGGDARHFRFLAFSYCLVLISAGGIVEKIFSGMKFRARYLYSIGITVAVATFFCYPRQLLNHPILRTHYFEHRQYLKINDAAVFRVHDELPSLFSSGKELDFKTEMKRWEREKKTIFQSNVEMTGICYSAYMGFDRNFIISYGLTDAFLARTQMPSDRAAHKEGLNPLAEDIVQVRQVYGFRRDAFRQASNSGNAPEWVDKNLLILEAIERKVYNTHNFWENLLLALKPIRKIRP
jgi:hypothetical protein